MKKLSIAAIAGLVVLGAALSAEAQERPEAVSNSRAAAIHQCTSQASRYPETTWSSLEFELYRACMAEHGQVE